jgi:uncharacterized protein
VKIVDLNLLLYAVNADSPRHDTARVWLENLLNGEEVVGLPWVVVLGYLRISTNARAMTRALKLSAALERVEDWLALSNVRLLREKDDHWDRLRKLLAAAGTAGNLTTDAHLAALAISHDAVLCSSDLDFGRFKGLRWENPLH